MLRAAAIALILCGVSTPLQAAFALSQWVHKQWQTDRGLPQNSVYSMAQDNDGFLWVGTENGLVRYDGADFKTVTQHTRQGLQHEFVSSLLAASDGSIWAGTRTGGLVRYRRDEVDEPVPELAEERVFALAQTRDGTIWISTRRGLERFRENRLTFLPLDGALAEQRVTALYASDDGALWVGGSSGGIGCYSDGRLATYRDPIIGQMSSVNGLAKDRSGTVWIARDGDGLFRFRGNSFERVELSGKELEYLQALLVDDEGAVWVGTDHEGILRYKDGEVSSFNSLDGLNTESVLSLFQDREGSIWAGALFGGLHRFHRGAFVTFGRREGLPADAITCVLETEPNVLLLGTKAQGVLKKVGGTFERVVTPGLNREIRAMLKTSQGEIWIGGKDGGILRMRGGESSYLRVEDGLAANDVSALFEARGEIWIGSQRSGVSVFNLASNRVTQVHTTGPLQRYIRSFAQDNDGAIWIGTQVGLVKFSAGMIELIDLGEYSDASVRALLVDSNNTLWIGTRDYGLLRRAGGEFFHYGLETGLTQARIYQFLRGDDKLWMPGTKGIEVATFADLEAVAAGRQERVLARLFTESEGGLRTSECGGDASPSTAVTSDGAYWFATRRGLAQYTGADQLRRMPAPKVVIETVRLDNETVPAHRFARVPADVSRIQFRYTAPALAGHEQVRFCYRLEGFEKEWVEAGAGREMVYSHLAPGKYRLLVAVDDYRRFWSPRPAVLSFVVVPHFYQTAWFYGVMALLSGGGVRWLYRWRVAGIQRRSEQLEDLVEVRTRELQEEVAQRRRAEEEQIALNATLETHVQERTAQVQVAYRNLQEELAERKRIEQELAASEARLRRVVDSGMVGILFWTHDGRIVDANDTFLKMVGFSRAELAAGELFWDRLTPPEYIARDTAALEEIDRTGVCTPFEKEYLRKDGSRFPVLIGGASLSPEARDGVCFVLDISERKAAEQEVMGLAQSLEARVHERTRELARINEQLAGEVQERKRVAVALSAFSQLGQKLHGTRTESEAANIIALTAKSLIPHDICTIELYGSDNQLYPVISATPPEPATAEPMRSSISVSIRNGTRVIGVIGLKSSAPGSFMPNDANTLQALGDYCGGALDRIHAEEARRETERRFVAFMTNAPAMAWMKDSEFRYVFTNPMFQKFAGMPGPEIEGKKDSDLWPDSLSARIQANDLQVLASDSTVQTEETFTRAGQPTRTLLTFRFPFTTASGERFIAGMALDISEQKRAEEALHLLPQAILEAQEQERRRLARELHDGVNQAIASAKFRIQTAENQILRGDQKWQESCSRSKEMLDSVIQQVRRLSHNLRPGELDDLGLLAAARTAFAEFEDRTGMQVHFAVTGVKGRLDPTIESTFYRVIQEALTNIEKHSGATAVDIHLTQNAAGVSLEISDNGIGFDPSQQNSRHGLGLLHMRERANLVGAQFSVETAPGVGVRLAIHAAHQKAGTVND